MKNRVPHSVLFIALLILFSSISFDQDRGLSVVAKQVAGTDINIGKQYVVFIAIDRYQKWNPLHNPVNDAKEIKGILEKKYYIDEFLELYNADATGSAIRALFSNLIDRVGPTDSVLIYYAGHGYLDKTNTGFWIPVDGGTDVNEQDHWVPNAQIKNFVTKINARSVVLISDSCFSGDLLATSRGISPTIDSAYFRNALRYTAKQVLTSGAAEAVPDESEFAREFKAVLKNNTEQCLDPLAMYDRIRRGVSKTEPLLGTLPGNQTGGSYVLFLRQAPQKQVKVASLILDGVPESASILISGNGINKRVEATDVIKIDDLPIGTYSLQVMYPLWKALYSTKLEIKQEGEFHQSIPSGWLEIASLPQEASLMIDGKRFNTETTAGTEVSPLLLAGTYTLNISAPYVHPVSLEVAIQVGKATQVSPLYNGFGVLILTSAVPTLSIQLSRASEEVISFSKQMQYEIAAGDYILKAKPSDDSDWSWEGRVSLQNGTTISYQIPKEASEHSIVWKLRKENEQLSSLKEEYDRSVGNQKTYNTFGTTSLITAGVSAVTAGVFYFLGSMATTAYHNATTIPDAQGLRSSADLYSALFISSASITGVSLGLGGIFYATAPNPKKIDEQVQSSIEEIKKLEAERVAKGMK